MQRIQLTPKHWKEGIWMSCIPCLLVETEIGTIPLTEASQFVITTENRKSFRDSFILEGGKLLSYECLVTDALKKYLTCKKSISDVIDREEL